MISQALIMDRTEKGIVFNTLTATKYIGLNEVKELDQKEVKDFGVLDGWIYYLKHRHEEWLREKIEEIKAKDETIRDLDNCMLDLEDDVSFMRKMSIAIDKACDEMDLRDAQEAREEARLAKEDLESTKEDLESTREVVKKQKQEVETVKQEVETVKREAELAKQEAIKQKLETQKQKQRADEHEQKERYLALCMKYLKDGYTIEEAESRAKKDNYK